MNINLEQKKEFIAGLLFSLFGIFMIYFSFDIEVMDMGDTITSSTFPSIVGSLVLICGLIVIVSVLRKVKNAEPTKQSAVSKVKFDTVSAILGFACFVFYAILFQTLGFIASSALFLFTLMNVMSPKRPTMHQEMLWLGLSIIIPVVVYAIFVHLLSVTLPEGIIYF